MKRFLNILAFMLCSELKAQFGALKVVLPDSFLVTVYQEATVSLSRNDTILHTISFDSSGKSDFRPLQPGFYSVQVAIPNLHSLRINLIKVHADKTTYVGAQYFSLHKLSTPILPLEAVTWKGCSMGCVGQRYSAYNLDVGISIRVGIIESDNDRINERRVSNCFECPIGTLSELSIYQSGLPSRFENWSQPLWKYESR